MKYRLASPSHAYTLLDLNYHAEAGTPFTVGYWMPSTPSHPGGDGNADGGNVAFLDGHVKWQPLIPGTSWRVFATQNLGQGFWTPSWMDAPPGADILD